MTISIETFSIVCTVAIAILSAIYGIITSLLKKTIVDRLDKFEEKMDKFVEDNHKDHKEIWQEHNDLRERVAKVEIAINK